MPGILTLTMNPAIDVSTSVERMEPARKLRCGPERRDPGGGGINVARVARRLGAEAAAVFPAGGFTGRALERMVEAEGVRRLSIPIAGDTREDFTVFDRSAGQEYRFVLPGPRLEAAELAACLDAVAAECQGAAFVCASGSLPPGAPEDVYARLAKVVGGCGARLVLDTSGAGLKRALEQRPYLIKPNLNELRELAGEPLPDLASALKACRRLIETGAVEVVALTMGAEGAAVVSADQAWRASPPPVRAISTVGAGDSFLGAMVWALAENRSLEEALRYGVAGGSAAVLAAGTELCRAEDVRRLLDAVEITPVGAD